MRRRSQLQSLKESFPFVDVKTMHGTFIYQGFIAGEARALNKLQTESRRYREEIEVLRRENVDLTEQLMRMSLLLKKQDEWMKTGDESSLPYA